MFVDASALCAVLLGEPDAAAFEQKLVEAEVALTSSIAIFETVQALSRVTGRNLQNGIIEVEALLRRLDIEIVQVGIAEGRVALEAADSFGKGRHPARLNMGDCFAYACARTHDVPLLFKGEDFALTDVVGA